MEEDREQGNQERLRQVAQTRVGNSARKLLVRGATRLGASAVAAGIGLWIPLAIALGVIFSSTFLIAFSGGNSLTPNEANTNNVTSQPTEIPNDTSSQTVPRIPPAL